jgi:hypothetical protein
MSTSTTCKMLRLEWSKCAPILWAAFMALSQSPQNSTAWASQEHLTDTIKDPQRPPSTAPKVTSAIILDAYTPSNITQPTINTSCHSNTYCILQSIHYSAS